MAKSIRSKVKKRNRSEMRRTVGDPYAKKLQAKCTSKIQKAVAFSQGPGIGKLKSMLAVAQAANPVAKERPRHRFVHRNPGLPEGVVVRASELELEGDEEEEEEEEEDGEATQDMEADIPEKQVERGAGGAVTPALLEHSGGGSGRARARSRSMSDLDAQAMDEETAMDEGSTVVGGLGVVQGDSGARAGPGAGVGVLVSAGAGEVAGAERGRGKVKGKGKGKRKG